MAGLQQICVLQSMLWKTEREQILAELFVCSIPADLQAFLVLAGPPAIGDARI